ncbi:MAG: Holliday junction resolvase RuvX [Lachnospiraceae bacterium]|jgi:putative Holliday junction resolvase|nr:Holliday junction resolvase RuvX [Lachnospiraceae bacterium]MEE0685524.1 Holliday junction resolvase RuvX [Lachnospiraceae bacterium]MEE0862311.1 Holliday junction resolvase RuvX [Lachnospiraceae bacterium]
MRIMGLDFGSKTVGVAVSDALLITAQGIEIVRREQENKLRRTLARIEELVKEYEVEKIVLGLPKNMDGSCGERVEKTMEFKAMLERRTELEVIMWDERLTTVAADRLMMEANVRREDRKKYVDSIAATFILQGYLDKLSIEKRNGESHGRED